MAPQKAKKGVQVEVSYRGSRYLYPIIVVPDRVQFVRDLIVVLMQTLKIFSSSARVPALKEPRQTYMVPGLPLAVVNVPKDMRSPLAAALKVEVNVLNSHAFIGQSSGIRTVIKERSKVVVQQPDGKGWCMTKFTINGHMWDTVEQPVLACMAKQDTLFLAFALALPRSFDGCIWDAKQHAEQHAKAGVLLDYEYIPYEQFLRRMTVQHICEHWGEFEGLVAAEHGPGISTASIYRRLMLHKYSNTGLLTEALALCDLYNCSVDVYDCSSSKVYNLFPRKLAAAAPSEVALLRLDDCYHVLLPSQATDPRLPGFMCVPPEIVAAVFGERMIYTRYVAMGVCGSVKIGDSDVLPPVCLAMPPRPLQGADLAADPEPWHGESVNMFAFAVGRYYGEGVSQLQERALELQQQPWSSSRSCSNCSNCDSDVSSEADLIDTPVLEIPCADGGQAVARLWLPATSTLMWCAGSVMVGATEVCGSWWGVRMRTSAAAQAAGAAPAT